MGKQLKRGSPVICTNAAVADSAEGKVLVYRTPILPHEASRDELEALTTMEIVDDDGSPMMVPFSAAST